RHDRGAGGGVGAGGARTNHRGRLPRVQVQHGGEPPHRAQSRLLQGHRGRRRGGQARAGQVSQGPLAGVRVIEVGGIGPRPFCAMMLADMGADVLRVDRTGSADLGFPVDPKFSVLNRGRRSVALDLKTPAAAAAMKRLIAGADALIEGFRPGVMERLGLGPDACLAVNPRLVYGRMTGWGQEGPMAAAAGHDLNYLALYGVLPYIRSEG